MMTFLERRPRLPLLIAEVGVNHNGSRELARELVEAAIAAGADAVKFQSFHAEELAAASAAKARYQQAREPGGGQLEMLRKLELQEADFRDLAEQCGDRVLFLSSAFDPAYLKFLVEDLGMAAVKVASGEITNGPLLLAAARSGRPILLSTGMSSLEDIDRALAVIAFGILRPADAQPDRAALAALQGSPEARAALRERVALLHCVTEYPCPADEANLRAMGTLAEAFGLGVGYSDHTEGTAVAIAAATLGAEVIEKHLTLDRKLPGPDHAASLEPREFAAMVAAIREARAALGDGLKRPTASELPNRAVARRSLVAARPIAAGEAFSAQNLVAKRPGTGVPPLEYWDRLGQRARRAYAAEEPIDP